MKIVILAMLKNKINPVNETTSWKENDFNTTQNLFRYIYVCSHDKCMTITVRGPVNTSKIKHVKLIHSSISIFWKFSGYANPEEIISYYKKLIERQGFTKDTTGCGT